MSWKNDDWQAKQEQFRKSAGLKERLVREAQQLAHSDDFRSAGARMKQLGSEFKNAGFAGKDQNQRLWDEFSQARSVFYDRRNQYYERLNIEARDNAGQKRRIISELQSLLGVEDFREAGQRVWRDQRGPLKKEDREELNRRFWSAKDRFYSRRDAQFAQGQEQ